MLGRTCHRRDVFSVAMLAFASLAGFIMGFDTSVISGVKELPAWLERFGQQDQSGEYYLSTSNESLVVSILSAGTFFGALTMGLIADNFGRRVGIIGACLIFSAGVAVQTGASGIPAFAVGRVVTGYGLGALVASIPVYQSECSPKSIRGAIVICSQLATTIGLLMAAVVNQAARQMTGNKSWMIPIAIQIAFSGILMVGMVFLPESPRYLIKRGRNDEALHALSRLRQRDATDPLVVEEFEDIVKNVQMSTMNRSSYLDCFRQSNNKTRTRMLTALGFLGTQQLTGINFIFYYGTTFFVNSGIKDPYLISVLTNVVNVAATLPAFVLVDRMGRRPLLIWGAFFIATFQLVIGIAGVTIPQDNLSGQRVLVAFVFLYVAAFAVSWGPVAWVLAAEILPLPIRAKGLSMTNATNWAVNFGIGYSVPYLVNDKDKGGAGLGAKVYFMWGGLSCLCCLYAYFCIPETKRLSLEQVDMLFLNTTPRKSVAYHKELLASAQEPSIQDELPKLHQSNSQSSNDFEKGEKISV